LLAKYDHQGFLVLDYLYFANVYGKKIFDTYPGVPQLGHFADMLLEGYQQTNIQQVRSAYRHAILDADFVLPDGIALQLFYFLARKRWLANLNGTDFAPYCLQRLCEHYGPDQVRIALYGTKPHLLAKTKIFLEQQ
jgi:hypothetical protein